MTMTVTTVGLWAFLLHLLVCALFLILMYRGVIRVPAYAGAFLLFVPFWGCFCVVILHLHLRMHAEAAAAIPLEKLKIEDDIYKSLSLETVRESNVAPLEEVLLLASPDVRRRMMLDILNDSPEKYADVLLQARGGDDTEVVHYATTAMAEMSKQHDLQLQQYEAAFAKDPEDPQVLEGYISFLEDYLSHGFVQGRAEKIERTQLVKLLQKQWDKTKDPDTGLRLSRQLLTLQETSQARELLEEMVKRAPTREEPRLLLIECLALMGEGEAVMACIRDAREAGVYFSAQGSAQLSFWQDGGIAPERVNELEDPTPQGMGTLSGHKSSQDRVTS